MGMRHHSLLPIYLCLGLGTPSSPSAFSQTWHTRRLQVQLGVRCTQSVSEDTGVLDNLFSHNICSESEPARKYEAHH